MLSGDITVYMMLIKSILNTNTAAEAFMVFAEEEEGSRPPPQYVVRT